MELESEQLKMKIKWGRKKLEFIHETGDDFETFKVPPEKQKIIVKGKTLKDEIIYGKAKFKEGGLIGLVGKAEDKARNLDQIERKVFIEDLSKEERAKYLKEKYGEILAFGLVNLGNTCYVNSTMQVMRKIPELKQAICNGPLGGNPEGDGLVRSMKSVFEELENSGDTVEPRTFIATFMSVFPQFAQRSEHGGFQQQDADECFQNILNMVDPSVSAGKSLVDQLFSFDVEYTFSNTENEEEPSYTNLETLRKIPCIIDNQANPVNTLTEGIEAGLSDEIEKNSDTMERNCIYKKIGRVINLPNYLIVQKIRFIWKGKDKGTLTDARKAKILRAVHYPMRFDMEPFCSDSLKERLKKNREIQAQRDDERLENEKKAFEEFKAQYENDENMDTLKITKMFKKKRKEEELEESNKELWREHGTGLETGEYNLIGVITHKGRSADSGHYVGWSIHSGDTWFKYDDDYVTKVKSDEILNLKGGGDWHTAYYLIYRKLEISGDSGQGMKEEISEN